MLKTLQKYLIFLPNPQSSIPTWPQHRDVCERITSKEFPSTSNTDRFNAEQAAMFVSENQERLVSSTLPSVSSMHASPTLTVLDKWPRPLPRQEKINLINFLKFYKQKTQHSTRRKISLVEKMNFIPPEKKRPFWLSSENVRTFPFLNWDPGVVVRGTQWILGWEWKRRRG